MAHLKKRDENGHFLEESYCGATGDLVAQPELGLDCTLCQRAWSATAATP